MSWIRRLVLVILGVPVLVLILYLAAAYWQTSLRYDFIGSGSPAAGQAPPTPEN